MAKADRSSKTSDDSIYRDLEPGTRGTFIVADPAYDAATRLFSIQATLNLIAENIADEDHDDAANAIWMMAKLVEEVGHQFHHSLCATVVRSANCGQVDVEINGKATQPNSVKAEEFKRFMVGCLSGGKEAGHG